MYNPSHTLYLSEFWRDLNYESISNAVITHIYITLAAHQLAASHITRRVGQLWQQWSGKPLPRERHQTARGRPEEVAGRAGGQVSCRGRPRGPPHTDWPRCPTDRGWTGRSRCPGTCTHRRSTVRHQLNSKTTTLNGNAPHDDDSQNSSLVPGGYNRSASYNLDLLKAAWNQLYKSLHSVLVELVMQPISIFTVHTLTLLWTADTCTRATTLV